jgi:hypothetical protein
VHNVKFKADFSRVAVVMLMLAIMFVELIMLMISTMVMMNRIVFVLLSGLPDYYRVWLPASACSAHN